MSAKEMFEALGYKTISYGEQEIIEYDMELGVNEIRKVVFNLDIKTFWYGDVRTTYFDGCRRKEYHLVLTTIDLYKAINQQCKELFHFRKNI